MRFASVLRLLLVGVAVLPSSPAKAAGALLVVVEATGTSVAADDVRAAVAKEIRRGVMAPLAGPIDTDGDTLLVAVNAHRALLSLRSRQGQARQRTIELPDGRKEQLKTIGWIAMNLVTDQVDGFAEPRPASEEPPLPPATAPVNDEASPAPQEPSALLEPPPPAPPATAPVASPPPATKAGDSVRAGWSLSAFYGIREIPFGGDPGHPWPWHWTWIHETRGPEVAVEFQKSYDDWLFGLALDMGRNDQPAAALAAFAGDAWQWGKLRLDATAGLGLELTERRVMTKTQSQSTDGGIGASSQIVVTTELRPRLYGRGNLTLAWEMRPAVAVLFRLGLHLSPDDVYYCYASALLGLRVNFP